MKVMERYHVLSEAFEKARTLDDWAAMAGVVADDVVQLYPLDCPGGGAYDGREAMLFFLLMRERLLTRCFDHCYFEWREYPKFDEVSAQAGWLSVQQRAGLPELRLEFVLNVVYDEHAAIQVDEDLLPESRVRLREYLERHGAALGVRTDLLDLTPSEELCLLTRGMQRIERTLHSRNRLPAARCTADLAEPAWVDCRTTWRAPGMPDLTLEYMLEYRFGDPGNAQVQESWSPEMRERLRAHLSAHGAAIEKRAAAATRTR